MQFCFYTMSSFSPVKKKKKPDRLRLFQIRFDRMFLGHNANWSIINEIPTFAYLKKKRPCDTENNFLDVRDISWGYMLVNFSKFWPFTLFFLGGGGGLKCFEILQQIYLKAVFSGSNFPVSFLLYSEGW